jgi:hypothetical protein
LFLSELGGIGLGGLGMRLLAVIYYGRVLILYFMVWGQMVGSPARLFLGGWNSWRYCNARLMCCYETNMHFPNSPNALDSQL